MTRLPVLRAVLVMLIAAACSSQATHVAAPTTSTPTTSATPTAAPLTASGVGHQLARLLPVTVTVVYSARTDPNHLLGRPTGYLSKVAFADHRVKPKDAQGWARGDLELGGSVEVFATTDRAASRASYIQRLQSSSALYGTEYDYLAGPVLLRVTGYLTPRQAATYKHALSVITDHNVVGPV